VAVTLPVCVESVVVQPDVSSVPDVPGTPPSPVDPSGHATGSMVEVSHGGMFCLTALPE
jgi:hypothetical protein